MATTVKAEQFLEVYRAWVDGHITQPCAASRLGMSERTFRRYVTRYRTEGLGWLEGASAESPPSQAAPSEETAAVVDLYSRRYQGWNAAHFYERYRDDAGGQRSYVWVKTRLQEAGLVDKGCRRNASCKAPSSAPARDLASPREGAVIHYFASRYEWVPGQRWDLVVTVDDATSRVHSGFFVDTHGVWSVFNAVREILLKRGLFDNFTLGGRGGSGGGMARSNQLSRAMQELGIELHTGWVTRVRSARVLRTLRGRLPNEIMADGAKSLPDANAFLRGFWKRHNHLYAACRAEPPSAFDPLLDNSVLRNVLCLKFRGSVGFGNRIVSRRTTLPIPRDVRNRLVEGQLVTLCEYEDGCVTVFKGRDEITTVSSRPTRVGNGR